MTDLKTLGQRFNSLVRDVNTPASRPLTADEETGLMASLNELVDMSGISIEYVGESPYENEYQLRLDVVMNNRFRTPLLSCTGLMSDEAYTLYRAAHDIRNHVLQNKSFSPFDELLSAFDLTTNLESKVSQYVLDFIFTDVLLINSVYAFNKRSWQTLKNGSNGAHRVCCFKTWNDSGLLKLSKH